MRTHAYDGRRLTAYELQIERERERAARDFDPEACSQCGRGRPRPLACRLANGATHWSCGAPAPAGWIDPQTELGL